MSSTQNPKYFLPCYGNHPSSASVPQSNLIPLNSEAELNIWDLIASLGSAKPPGCSLVAAPREDSEWSSLLSVQVLLFQAQVQLSAEDHFPLIFPGISRTAPLFKNNGEKKKKETKGTTHQLLSSNAWLRLREPGAVLPPGCVPCP